MEEVTNLNDLSIHQLLYFKDFLTVNDLAVYLSIGRNTAIKIMEEYGLLIGKSYKIPKNKIVEIAQKLDTKDKAKYKE